MFPDRKGAADLCYIEHKSCKSCLYIVLFVSPRLAFNFACCLFITIHKVTGKYTELGWVCSVDNCT